MEFRITNKYYNEMMWPKRFADCISLEEAIEMMEKQLDSYHQTHLVRCIDSAFLALCRGNVQTGLIYFNYPMRGGNQIIGPTKDRQISKRIKT